MAAPRRSTLVASISITLAALSWVAVLSGLLAVSNAVWITLGVALAAFVALKFHRHVETPDSMHLT